MLDFLIDIASEPSVLVALIAVLGSVMQRKSISEVITGGVKTFVGFLVLSGGADIVVEALEPFGVLFENGFNIQGVVPNNEAIISTALETYGSQTALIMLLGMVFNIIIARFSKYKYIFLTGHHTLYMAAMIAIILSVAGFTGLELLLWGGIVLGIIMVISPAIVQKYMIQTTGQDQIAMGHFSAGGYWLSAWIGEKVGDKEQSTEDIEFPKGLSFMRDNTVSIGLTMTVIYMILVIVNGASFVESELSDGTNFLIYALTLGGLFAAGIFVILSGVRLILGEIVPAFRGISEKLVPDAKAALDVPTIFPYAPNAVLIGFLTSFIGGIVSMLIMIVSGTVVILPGVIPHFFTGAAAGVLGNTTGGVKGSVFGSFANGVLISFLPILLLPVLGDLGFVGSTFSDADFAISGIYLGQLANMGGKTLVIAGIVLVLA
ncbi:MAG: PTS ascorbate transporter subunit IIC, partial [Atopostipes sp.]|nr:PTS ascorbate transporter subunit IIC [Atopostipes sp.]